MVDCVIGLSMLMIKIKVVNALLMTIELNLKVSNKMTNENELDVLAVLDKLAFVGVFLRDDKNITNAINLIKSQKSRIEILENAIRDATKYHQGYVDKLKETDRNRSLRQQERFNYFMNILENKS
jgi:hypothetical protein